VAISDVTPPAREVHALVSSGELDRTTAPLPEERPYPPAEDVLGPLRV
jgi:hypothetical protein